MDIFSDFLKAYFYFLLFLFLFLLPSLLRILEHGDAGVNQRTGTGPNRTGSLNGFSSEPGRKMEL
jgi:hypothetical protein